MTTVEAGWRLGRAFESVNPVFQPHDGASQLFCRPEAFDQRDTTHEIRHGYVLVVVEHDSAVLIFLVQPRKISVIRENHAVTVARDQLSLNAIERSFQFDLVEMTAAASSDYRQHTEVFDDVAARNVFPDEAVADRIDAFRSEHRSRFYYDIDRPGRDFGIAMLGLPAAVHQHLVEFADAHHVGP